MRRKPDRQESLLQSVIRDLEDDHPSSRTQHHRAVLTLLAGGPLSCKDALGREIQDPATDQSIRGEILAFLRDVIAVRDRNLGRPSYPVSTYGHVTFRSRHASGRTVVEADAGSVRDLIMLQLVLLLDRVGLRNVRECRDEKCRRIFVKTYRREFCSEQCQGRDQKRRERQAARTAKERAEQRRIAKRRT